MCILIGLGGSAILYILQNILAKIKPDYACKKLLERPDQEAVSSEK